MQRLFFLVVFWGPTVSVPIVKTFHILGPHLRTHLCHNIIAIAIDAHIIASKSSDQGNLQRFDVGKFFGYTFLTNTLNTNRFPHAQSMYRGSPFL